MEEELIGSIKMFAGDFAPEGWLLCQGQLLSVQEYEVLFSIIGNTYGGDGKKNFALPDLSGNLPVGFGSVPNAPYLQVGETGGNAYAVIPRKEITHLVPPPLNVKGTIKIRVANEEADTFVAVGNGLGRVTKKYPTPVEKMGIYQANPTFAQNKSMLSGAVNLYLETREYKNPNTGDVSVPHMPPYMAINFIIAVEGVYPRNLDAKVKGKP